jgi:formylmethanofuran dehydrogenase subunit E
MNKDLDKTFQAACKKHGEFIFQHKDKITEDQKNNSVICPKCIEDKKNKFKNYSPLKWV